MNAKSGKVAQLALKRSKTVSSLRSFKTVTDDKLRQLKTKWMKQRTFNKMLWGVRAYNDWRNSKLSNLEGCEECVVNTDLEKVSEITKDDFIEAMCRFIPEVTKVCDRADYPGKPLYELVVSIQKFLHNNGKVWKIIDDPHFSQLRTVLDNVMKERAIQNIGMVRKQAQFITADIEAKLWEQGTLGEDTPNKLRDTVLYLLGINLGLRAVDEHYHLRRGNEARPSQLSFEWDSKGIRCLVYRKDMVTKTNDGEIGSWLVPSPSASD